MKKSASCFVFLLTAILLAAICDSRAEQGQHAYVGSKKCRLCHLREWKSWQETKMANSFELLKPGKRSKEKKAAGLDPQKDYTKDATCIPCHVTGYGQKGGFVDIETTPDLAGTGCEMCHGPGGTYTKNEFMSLKNREYKKADVVAVGLIEKVGVEQCRVCHNEKSPFVGDGYVFNFEERREEGTHEKFPLKFKH